MRHHTSAYAYVSIRQHTSASVSIRQHTSVSIRQHTSVSIPAEGSSTPEGTAPPIRQHTSAYASIHSATERRCTRIRHPASAYVMRQHTSAYVSACERRRCLCLSEVRAAYVSIRPHTSAYVSACERRRRLCFARGASESLGPACCRMLPYADVC